MSSWNRASLIVGIVTCVLYAIFAFGGVPSPVDEIGQGMMSGGRGGSGYYIYGGGK